MKGLILALLFLPQVALASSGIEGVRRCQNLKILLDNNDLSTSRTFNIEKLDGYDHIKLDVKYTHATNGTITLDCTYLSAQPADISRNLYTRFDTQPTTCTTTTGSCTLNLAGQWVIAVSGDVNYGVDWGILNIPEGDCTITHSAGTSNDFVTVTGRKCVR